MSPNEKIRPRIEITDPTSRFVQEYLNLQGPAGAHVRALQKELALCDTILFGAPVHIHDVLHQNRHQQQTALIGKQPSSSALNEGQALSYNPRPPQSLQKVQNYEHQVYSVGSQQWSQLLIQTSAITNYCLDYRTKSNPQRLFSSVCGTLPNDGQGEIGGEKRTGGKGDQD